jgi:hypothetical protein
MITNYSKNSVKPNLKPQILDSQLATNVEWKSKSKTDFIPVLKIKKTTIHNVVTKTQTKPMNLHHLDFTMFF